MSVRLRTRGGPLPHGAPMTHRDMERATRKVLAAVEDVDEVYAEVRSLAGLWIEMVTHPGPLNVDRLMAFHRRLQRVAQRGLSREDRQALEALTGLALLTNPKRKPAGQGGLSTA